MPKGLSYADAVRLLGGSQSRVVAALDRLAGGALLAATGGGSGLALSLFDAKSELARLSGELVSGLGNRLSRMRRGEQLRAAHVAIASVPMPGDTSSL